MRILVHEFVSGGGLSGQWVPPGLSREGAAMRDALVADLAALQGPSVVATADPRFPLRHVPIGVEVEMLPPGRLDRLLASVDAVWLVAPETNRCLERLAARVEQLGTPLLGSSAAAIRRASDKARLPALLARQEVSHPATRRAASRREAHAAARSLGFPIVVKPGRGAGCGGVGLVKSPGALAFALDAARRADGAGPLLLQRYVEGVAASVSLLVAGERAVPLAVSAQAIRASRSFTYRGGTTPLDHPRAAEAARAARRVCEALPGLRGYVGVDVVLTDSGAVVIEVNPRLTTSYLGVREAIDANVAGLVLAACAGRLPKVAPARRRVCFTEAGRLESVDTLR